MLTATTAVRMMASVNPATGEEIVRFPEDGAREVARAVDAARDAAPQWAATSPVERSRLLLGAADSIERRERELVEAVIAEVGKPRREAREEVRRSAAIVRYHAGNALDPVGTVLPAPGDELLLFTSREPLGVVGLITPWNFPLAIPMWKLAPALAHGNTVVLKPAPAATRMAWLIEELLHDLPDDVLTLVTGGSETGRAVAQSALDGLSFTGSTAAGLAVAADALRSGARYQGELGGKNASVVLGDADLDRAAITISRAAMGYAGQKCTATSRVIVEQAAMPGFREALVSAVRALRVDSPEHETTDVGPLIDRAALERTAGFVERAVEDGAEVLAGGHAIPQLGENYFAPTLIGNVDNASELAQTEVFGPVLVLIAARDAAHAVQLANESRYGLAAAVFTRDISAALRFSAQLDAGVVRINGATPGVTFNAPFAPAKASGIGSPEQGKAARDFFTRERTVTVTDA